MTKIFKTSLFLLLALLLPVTAFSHDFEVDGIYYNINGNEATVTYKGSSYYNYSNEYSGSVIIPSTVTYAGNTYPVVSIGESAFYGCTELTNVAIPNSIKSLGEYAFIHCSGLTSIYIPNSILSIGEWAFLGCSGLRSITVASDNPIFDSRSNCNAIIETAFNTLILGCMNTVIPNSVTVIGRDAFRECSGLVHITIPNSIKSIGTQAFCDCTGLKSINIPNSVTSISSGAFMNCEGLTNISVANGNIKYDSRDNCNAIIMTSNNTLIVGCMNTIIPESIKKIGNHAFHGCRGINCINIPNSVTAIGDCGFAYCTGLTSINLGNSITTIGNSAFDCCEGLTTVNIGNSIITIGSCAFRGCGLTSITIPNSVTTISSGAFSWCSNLTNVTCLATTPPTLQSSNVFDNNTYSSATLKVFQSCKSAYQAADYWKNFLIIQGLEDVFEVDGIYYHTPDFSSAVVIQNPDEGYYHDDVIIPDSISYQDFTFTVIGIDANAFDGCDELNSVVIGNAVETIGEEAFQGCTGLTSLTIGSAVTSIGERAFNYCNALQTVKCLGTVPPAMANSNCFSLAAYRRATLKVHRNYIDTYAATDFWYKFEHIEGYGSLGNGDVNGDGIINIDDVTATIDQLLGGSTESDFYFESADLNYNGRLDIGDVTTLIDLLLTH